MLQRSRVLAVATLGAVFVLFIALEARLFIVQIVNKPDRVEKVRNYQYKRMEVPVPRGRILDRKGELLAGSIPALEVWALTRDVDKPWTEEKDEREATAVLLARVCGLDPGDTYRALCEPGYRPIHRSITDPDVMLDLYRHKRKGDLRGIDLCKKHSRRYPNGELLGHVIGFVNHDMHGVSGVESLMNAFLEGRGGSRTVCRDGVQNVIYTPDEKQDPGMPGGTVCLTIDTAIQFFAEMELAKVETTFNPKWAAAVVIEPSTGKILAAAGTPSLDPSHPGRGTQDHWINRVFSAQYTPGSSFKPLIMAMALEQGKVRLDESIDCEGGQWVVRGRRVTDVHVNYRMLDPEGILIKSSNIGMSKIALRLVPEATPKGGRAFKPILDILHLLGFGKRPGILSPAQEAPGQVTRLKDWTRIYTLISISFGNEIAVTPIQMASAFAAMVNGGMYVPPALIERMITPDGREIEPPSALPHRIFSESTCNTVKKMLVQVVEKGSGKKARIPCFAVGGKTGTAEKLPARTEVTSSFVAFAPADNPALLVLVVVDEPHGMHYASQVAAPHAGAILERSLLHLRVTPRGGDGGVSQGEG